MHARYAAFSLAVENDFVNTRRLNFGKPITGRT